MQMKPVKLWMFLIAMLMIGMLSLMPRLNAQATPAQINEPHGDQPFGAYQSSDIDNISFANGAVDVRIPLFSHSGRGLPHGKSWTYTSKAWAPLQTTTPCDPSITQCPPPTPAVWTYVDNTNIFSSIQQYRTTTCHDGHMHSEWTDYTYVDRSGTTHVFDAVTATQIPVPNCIHPKLVGYSLDNSGMRLDTTTGIITFKDGSTAQGPVLFKDANGNSINAASPPSTSEIDTLGRTVQHLTGTLPDGAQYEDWTAQDSAGNPQTTRIEWAMEAVCTNFGQGDTQEDCPASLKLARKIDLPNGLAYQFTYDTGTTPGHYGELLRIDLPSGGYIRYEYAPISSAFSIYNTIRAVTKRAVSADGTAASEKAWTYTYQLQTPDISSNTTLVTDPGGNQTAHVIGNTLLADGSPVPLETETRFYQGSTTLLKTVRTDYSSLLVNVGDSDDPTVTARELARPIRVTTILDNGLTSKVETDYDPLPDTNGVISFSRSNVTERREYDYGDGATWTLLRRTDYTYQHNANSAYATANIVNKVLNTIVYDGAGNIVAQTQNGYDETPLANTNPSGNCQTPNGAPNHDYCAFGTGNLMRGNLTSVKRWRNTDNTWLTTTFSYDDLGNMISSTDPGGHVTTYNFADSWSGASCITPGVNTYAFLTQATDSLNFRTQASYYSCPGLAQSKRDENDILAGRAGTTFTYDTMNRLLTATSPDGGQSSFNYHSDLLPLTVTKTELATPDPSIISSVIYDGLGRVKTGSLDSDPPGADITDTTYDNLGRKATVSNPHRSTTASTDGITTFVYDVLGRPTSLVKQDGSTASTIYSGNSVTVTDEAGKQRRSISDALGRLLEVDEPGDNFAGVTSAGSLSISGVLRSAGTPTSGSGTVTISGAEQTYTDFNDCTFDANGFETCATAWDSGFVSITVNGKQETEGFGQGDTSASIASGLASQFNADGTSPVTASISGSVITLRAKAAGAATNYSLSVTYSSQAGSFSGSASGANLTGGTDGGAIVYDAGNVQVSVGTFSASVPYGQSSNSTPAAVASALTSALNVSGSPVTAGVSGSSITLTFKIAGANGNVAVSSTSATTQTAYFSGGSFCSPNCTTTLTGGQDTEGPSLDHNFYVTQYSYNTLGNLLTVTQKGDPAVNSSSQWRVRNFTYDSLSRILTASNPESGTITYFYDADGNLLQKTSPLANQTGTATQTVSYCYDALHRVTGKGYGAQSCPLAAPVVTYAYDSGTNAKGHLTSLADQAGSGSYTYDIMGRMATETRSLIGANNAAISKNMSYSYDLAGFPTSLTYPSGKVITYTPDSAGRTLSAVDNGSGINYITGATYGPDGGITGFVSGSGGAAAITSAFAYNKRLQPVTMSATTPSQTLYSIGYDFHVGNGNNGNVFGITNYKDTTRNQTFSYDALNRVISAQNAGTNCSATTVNGKTEYWGNSYGYDAWGNLLNKSVTKCSAENFSVAALTNNRLSGYGYDAAGNMTTDPTDNLTLLNYDQENRITGSAGYAYTYDSDGNRVRKSNGNLAANGTLYWYMMPGVVAETDLAGTTKSEYIFFDGERVARRDGATGTGGVFYYFSDHLKTASVITDSAGVIKAESDYYPWGGELQFVNNDSNDYKFTGKKRDTETGLDYFGARYYSNGMGRFVTPDWSPGPATVPYAHLDNPQTLNLYSYVDNNPINGIDADGHAISHAFDGMVAGLDAGSPADEGGPTQTQAALTLAAMSSSAFGWQLQAQQAQNTTPAQTNNPKEDTLTNVVYNETGSLSASSKAKPGADGSADQLHQARVEVAEAAERVLESKHPGRVQADDTLSSQTLHDLAGGNKKVIAALKDSRGAAESALGGSNLSNGAMHYRTSHHIVKKLYGQKAEHFGPFRDALGGKTYIMVAP
jgi:RHS repeat-associated protein